MPAVGADSPEEAVDEMISAIERVDVERMIELTPPDEMGVLHDYAPLFLDELRAVRGWQRRLPRRRVPRRGRGRRPQGHPHPLRRRRHRRCSTPPPSPTTATDDRVSLLVDQDGSATEVALVQARQRHRLRRERSRPRPERRGPRGRRGTLAIDVKGTVDGEDLSAKLTATPDGDCILVSGDATSGDETEPIAEQLCPEDFSEEGLSFAGSPITLADVLDNMGELVQFDNFSRLFDLGVVTVEVDGDWYVSPLRSTTELISTFAALAEGI